MLAQVLLLVIGVLVVWHAFLVTAGVGNAIGSPGWTPWLAGAVWLGATLVCLIRARTVAEDRAGWWALTAATGCAAVAMFAHAIAYGPGDKTTWLTVTDASWLAFYPLACAAIVVMMRQRVREFTVSNWVDSLVSGLAAAAVVAAVTWESPVGGKSGLVSLENVASPAADLVLVVVVVGFLSVTGWRPGRAWFALGAGLLCLATMHSATVIEASGRSQPSATWVDSVWLVGVVFVASAGWASAPRQISIFSSWRTLSIPVLSIVGGAAVLAYQTWAEFSGVVGSGLALAAILLATVRTGLAFRALRAFADSRREIGTDALTGLPNRRRLFAALGQYVRRNRPFAVLLLDLDGFSEINDALGHSTGDLLLTQVAGRLEEHRKPGDMLARLGADEFAMVARGVSDIEAAQAATRELAAALTPSFRLGSVSVAVEVSAGVALFPEHADSPSELLSRAGAAMNQAKRERSEHAVHDPTRYDNNADRLGVVAELREGLTRGELVAHYQPQIQLGTGALIGLEALARWQHPRRGLLGPDAFLPQVGHMNVMRPLTEEMLRTVLDQMRRWRLLSSVRLHVPVSVNAAAPNLVDPNFAVTVSQLLTEYGAKPSELVIEVTENAVLTDTERVLRVLHDLHELGVGLSIDDFGTGLSSLQRLRTLPVDEVKIDKSFVLGLPDDIRDMAVVEASVILARRMGLQVIAEGAETAEICEALLSLGCDRAQGFHFARPLSADALETWDAHRAGAGGRHRSSMAMAARSITAPKRLAGA